MKEKVFKRYLLAIFIIFQALLSLTVADSIAINTTDDELAWKIIEPRIESFWKDYQTSPQRVKDTVWPLISMLKNFIKAYPKSKRIPEAYYILGEAYGAASYWPEAEAHWRIVIRYYPDSQWTNQALTNLIYHYETTGNQRKLRKFYREIIRQFPDTIAAKTIKVLLAKELLQRGRKDIAKRVIKDVEAFSIRPEVDVPELLDLKARLAVLDGRPQDAIRYWIRYINLTRSISSRAATLFAIAETYRKAGDYLKARKYYALIRRDYASQPEYLFARFRMIQMDEEARKRLSRYTRGKTRPIDFVTSEMIFEKILKRFPRHPITREVKREYVEIEMEKGDYLKTIELANNFLSSDPENPINKDIRKLAKEAEERLLKKRYSTEMLKRIVDRCNKLLTKKLQTTINNILVTALNRKWTELQKQLFVEKKYMEVLNEYWNYCVHFKPRKETTELAKHALLMADRDFLQKGKYEDLVNFYLYKRPKIDKLKVPEHYYLLAKAYSKLNFEKPSLRSFYKAWSLGLSKDYRCKALLDWTDEIFKGGRVKMVEDTISLLNIFCPNSSITSRVLLFKSKLALWQRDLEPALNMALDSISIKKGPENIQQAIHCGILLGKWDLVRKLFSENRSILSKKTQRKLIRFWGDEAYSLGELDEAKYAYNLLENLQKHDIGTAFRSLLVKAKQKGPSKTLNMWQDLEKKSQGIWKEAAKMEKDYYQFMKGVGDSL